MKFSDYDKYIKSTGTHYISNSGHDERGKYSGGTAGDQSGDEWSLRSWYNRPWSVVLRYEKDPRVGYLMACLSCGAALNNKIGYDQIQRVTYWNQLSKVGYDSSAITTACEDDCTAGVTANTKACGYILGITSLQNLSTSIYSGNMKSNFTKAGFTALTDSKYLTSAKYLQPGDVLLYVGHHAAANVTIGASIRSSYTFPNMTGVTVPIGATSTSVVESTEQTQTVTVSGSILGTAIAKTAMHIRDAASTSGTSLGVVAAGRSVDVYEILDNGWYKIKYGDTIGYTSNRNNAYYTYTANGAAYNGVVNCSKLNVRKGPGTSYGVAKVITNGTKVTISAEENNFGKIGTDQWVSLKYITKE